MFKILREKTHFFAEYPAPIQQGLTVPVRVLACGAAASGFRMQAGPAKNNPYQSMTK